MPVSFCLLHNTTLLSPWKTKADKGGRALVRPLGPLCKSFALTHGIRAANDDGVGIMDDSVADSVGKSGLADFLVPTAYLKL